MTNTHSFTPAVPVHTYQRIVEQIEHAILSGDIPVGSQLASERELMVQFSVSRPTVREALRVLQSMGLVESKPGTRGGPLVLAPSPKTLRRSFSTMLGTDALSIDELVQFRIVLEGSSFALAAQARTAEQLAVMRQAVERMAEAAASNAEDFASADLDFHEAVWAASGNQILHMSGQAVSGVLIGMMQRDAEGEHHDNRVKLESARIDRTLFDAIEAGDARLAATLARRAVADRYAPLLSEAGRASIAVLVTPEG